MSEAQSQTQKPLVLFVDDQPDIREFFGIGVSRYEPGFDAAFAENREDALRVIRDRHPAAVILDVNLVGETGMTIAADLREHYPHIRKAVLTAYDRSVTRANAEEFGMDVWTKPILMPELIEKVEALLAAPAAGDSGRLSSGVASNVLRAAAGAVALLWGAHVHKV